MSKYLRIYMNDQLALGVLWRDIAQRAERKNRGTDVGDALAEVAAGIAEDVETFKSMIDRLGLPTSRVKSAIANVAAQAARLKLDTPLTDYTDLNRFEDLDFLAMGIDGKKLLWATLRDHAELSTRLPGVDFDHLIERADRQRAELEPHRAQAGRQALTAAAGSQR